MKLRGQLSGVGNRTTACIGPHLFIFSFKAVQVEKNQQRKWEGSREDGKEGSCTSGWFLYGPEMPELHLHTTEETQRDDGC